MGFLLLQYEYQRANTQYNLCERTGIRLNNEVTRATKRVERMNTVFQKAQTQLENRWNNMSQIFNSQISTACNGAAASGSGAAAAFNGALSSIVIGGVSLGAYCKIDKISGTDERSILTELSNAAAQAKAVMAQLIQNAKDADEQKLQYQNDQQLQPIAEKESDIKAEQTLNEALTTLWEERKNNAKDRLAKDVEDGVAKYGLGR